MAEENFNINDFISEFKDLDLTISKLFLKESFKDDDKNVIMLSEDLLDKYDKDLDNLLISIDLTPEEEQKFFYNPHAVSYEFYKTPHLWFLILRANEIYSRTQLNMNPMRIYEESVLDLIKEILNKEQAFISNNEVEITRNILNEEA